MMKKLEFFVMMVLAASVTAANGATTSLPAVADTFIYDTDNHTSLLGPFGLNTTMSYYNNSSTAGNPTFDQFATPLVQFDLSSLPANAVISSAILRMSFSSYNVAGQTAWDLHAMTTPWVEASAIAATPDGSGTWAAGLGGYFGVGDYGASLGTATVINAINQLQSFGDIASTAQGWYDTPGSNKGLALTGFVGTPDDATDAYNGAMSLISRSNSQTAYRPVLDITYTVVPEPASFSLMLLGSGLLLLITRRRQK